MNSVIFWFHMPVFYFISGYLLKIPNKIDISNLCKKQCKTLLIPYGVTPVK
ncbi:MAG TPA: acyltransferase family protein [Ligilactobacillus agilis]|nr:acyltransferase family protein [Ligilactobacillus agilis]